MITQEEVKRLFLYVDGKLIRKVSTSNRVKIGDVVGNISGDGYCATRVNSVNYKIHRLIWLYHHGYFPEKQIDHIDKNRLNNNIENLREISQVCNSRNTDNSIANTSGVKGVSYNKRERKWEAYIKVNFKNKTLGRYKNFDDAVCARLFGEQCLEWEGCDNSSPSYLYCLGYKD